jgi:putrescine transport system ATP-binding protein
MRVARPQIAHRVGEMLDMVKLGSFAKRKPHQLSGGQRQRVALARALVTKPKLLLLDEPLAALDRKLREHTQFELINIQETLGVTFIVVTHDQEEAMTLSTRIGVMNHGGIVQVGTPTEIYEYPTSRFVTEFIGSVNMFEGRLIEDEPAYVRIRTDDFEAPVYVDHGVSAAPGATVWVAIRPEKVHIGREEPASPDNWAIGVVSDIAYMGDLSVYLLRLDSGKVVRVTQPNTYRYAEDRLTWDERVYLSWHASSPVVVTK